MSQSQDYNEELENGENSAKRHLRPRKIDNYKNMLEDEVTLKTIKDEVLEKKRMQHESDEEEVMEMEIERASDDEADDEDYGESKSASKLKRAKRVIDDEEEPSDIEEPSENEEEP
jgi:hypothetical protein